jgi:hypothetical protein
MFEEDAYEEDPLRLPKTVVIQPRHNNARLIAQHGWFTLHRYSQSSKRFVALEKNRETSGLLCYRVLGKSRRRSSRASTGTSTPGLSSRIYRGCASI